MPTFAGSIASILRASIRFHTPPNALLKRINNAITETTIPRSRQSVQTLDLCVRSALKTLVMEVFKDATEAELVLDALLAEEISLHLVTYRNPSPPESPLQALNQAYHRANQGLGPLGVESMVYEMYSGILKPLFTKISKLRPSFTDGELDMSTAASSASPLSAVASSSTASTSSFPKTSVATAAAPDSVSDNGNETQALARSSQDLLQFLADFTFNEQLRDELSALTNDLDEIEEKERAQYFELGIEVIRLGLAVSLSNTYDLAIAHRIRKLFIDPSIIDAIELTVRPPIRPGAILYFLALKFNRINWDDLRQTIKEVFFDSGLVNAAFKIVTANEPWLLKLVLKRTLTQEPYDPAYEALQALDLGPPLDEANGGAVARCL